MNDLSEWFNQLDPMLKLYWGIAVFASVVVLMQTFMSFLGTGDVVTGDVDVDFDSCLASVGQGSACGTRFPTTAFSAWLPCWWDASL